MKFWENCGQTIKQAKILAPASHLILGIILRVTALILLGGFVSLFQIQEFPFAFPTPTIFTGAS